MYTLILDLDKKSLGLKMDTINFIKGDEGKSAYEIAVENGFEGTEAEWLESLKGEAVIPEGTASEEWVAENYQPKGDYLTEIPSEYVTDSELEAKGYLTEHQSLEGYATETFVTEKISEIPTPDVSGQIAEHNADTTAHSDIREAIPTELSQLTDDAEHRVVTDAEKAVWDGKSDFSGSYTDLTNKPTIPTVPTKVSAFTNDAGYMTSYTETDPTVPSWAKASTKPTYTKSEIGLGNVDNVKQYSASNPPPYPVTSVNGKTGDVTIDVPSTLAELTDDSTHRVVTDEEKTAWNSKSDFSGSYTDLTDKPTIPTVPTKVSAFTNDSNYVTETELAEFEYISSKAGLVSEKLSNSLYGWTEGYCHYQTGVLYDSPSNTNKTVLLEVPIGCEKSKLIFVGVPMLLASVSMMRQ